MTTRSRYSGALNYVRSGDNFLRQMQQLPPLNFGDHMTSVHLEEAVNKRIKLLQHAVTQYQLARNEVRSKHLKPIG